MENNFNVLLNRLTVVEDTNNTLKNKQISLETENLQLKELAKSATSELKRSHNNLKSELEALKESLADDDENDFISRMQAQPKGYSRVSPQQEAEPKKSFPCNSCKMNFDTEINLNKHKKKCSPQPSKTAVDCGNCGTKFKTMSELNEHRKTEIARLDSPAVVAAPEKQQSPMEIDQTKISDKSEVLKLKDKNRQFNCHDCSFQGQNSKELRAHSKATDHSCDDLREVCHSCDSIFNSYKDLMNHRRVDHSQSRKECRYFKEGTCKFDHNNCWYKHSTSDANVNSQNVKPTGQDNNPQGFQKAQDNIPPESMVNLLAQLISALQVQTVQRPRGQ